MKTTVSLVFNEFRKVSSKIVETTYVEKFGIYVLCPFRVPYYVGKSEGKIINRIVTEHLSEKGLLGKETTYTIFDLDFYKNDKSRVGWVKRVAEPSKLFSYPSGENFPSSIIYLNNEFFFKEKLDEDDFKRLIPTSKKRDDKKWSLSKFPENKMARDIQDQVFKNNLDLFAIWAELQTDFPLPFAKKIALECCETAVKFCLMANTISKSDDLDTMAAKLELLGIGEINIVCPNSQIRALFHDSPFNDNGCVSSIQDIVRVLPLMSKSLQLRKS